jgi:hypothetical protein
LNEKERELLAEIKAGERQINRKLAMKMSEQGDITMFD